MAKILSVLDEPLDDAGFSDRPFSLKCLEFARPIMRRSTGFNIDQTWWPLLEESQNVASRLGDVETDCRNRSHNGLRMLLTHRKLLQSKAIAIDNDLRGTLRNFGLKVGIVGTVKFEGRIRELVENLPDLAELVEPLLIVRRALREQIVILHRRLLAIVRDDEVCRRLNRPRCRPRGGADLSRHRRRTRSFS